LLFAAPAFWLLRADVYRLVVALCVPGPASASESSVPYGEWLAVRLAVLLVGLPVFAVDVWLLVCRRFQARSARRLALPFGLATGLVEVASCWFGREAWRTLSVLSFA
jgi:hypothetical protein